MLPLDQWSGSTIGNVPIGQGIAVTPVQMAAAYAAIANGGVWLQPHLVERVGTRRAPRAEARGASSRARSRAADGDAAGRRRRGRPARWPQCPGYTVAGKTGTAAKPDPQAATRRRKYVASFVGFVPASEPRLVILVSVDEPQGAIWGGVVAAPAFRRSRSFALQYLEIPPDATPGA